MAKTITSALIGFVVGILAAWAWVAQSDRTNTHAPAQDTAPDITLPENGSEAAPEDETANNGESGTLNGDALPEQPATTALTVSDQAAGTAVVITQATLERDGWIVVHEEGDGVIGNALGALRRDAGTHEALSIPLLRTTQSAQRYWVVLYTDNGDRQFSLSDDTPVRTTNNELTSSSFTALPLE